MRAPAKSRFVSLLLGLRFLNTGSETEGSSLPQLPCHHHDNCVIHVAMDVMERVEWWGWGAYGAEVAVVAITIGAHRVREFDSKLLGATKRRWLCAREVGEPVREVECNHRRVNPAAGDELLGGTGYGLVLDSGYGGLSSPLGTCSRTN